MKTVLLTGGAGYIGSRLTDRLLELNYKIIIIDIFMYRKPSEFIHPNVSVYRLDIRSSKISEVFEENNKIDIVIHLANISNDPGYGVAEGTGIEINYIATKKLFELSKKHGVGRFIYPSSCSVYGSSSTSVVSENSPTSPLTNYAKCKLLCENFIMKNIHSNMITTIIRPATVYGASKRQRLDLLINRMVVEGINNRFINVERKNSIRPSIYIEDLIELYLFLMNAPKNIVHNEVFNVALHNLSIYEIATKVANLLSVNVYFNNNISNKDARSYSVNSNKIEKYFKLSKRSFEENILQMLPYISSLNNPLNDDIYYNSKIQPLYFRNNGGEKN